MQAVTGAGRQYRFVAPPSDWQQAQAESRRHATERLRKLGSGSNKRRGCMSLCKVVAECLQRFCFVFAKFFAETAFAACWSVAWPRSSSWSVCERCSSVAWPQKQQLHRQGALQEAHGSYSFRRGIAKAQNQRGSSRCWRRAAAGTGSVTLADNSMQKQKRFVAPRSDWQQAWGIAGSGSSVMWLPSATGKRRRQYQVQPVTGAGRP